MSYYLTGVLQCGALFIAPVAIVAIGLWLIMRFFGLQHKYSLLLIAAVFGLAFFVAALVGARIDPNPKGRTLLDELRIAALIGFGTFAGTLLLVPVLKAIRRGLE